MIRPVGALLIAILAVSCGSSSRPEALDTTLSTTTTAAASSTTAAPTTAPPSTTAPTTTTAAPTTTLPPPRFTLDPYRGLGAWLDVYDWTDTYSSKGPLSGTADIDRMADLGVDTLFIQPSRFDRPAPVIEASRFRALVARAHSRGMQVVAWYLPTLEDVSGDLQRLVAISREDVEGLALDIEGTVVEDDAERSRRLVALASRLRAALPRQTLGAIVLPPVVTEDLNDEYWSGFPWLDLKPFFDVWLPMAYWTNRTGEWRNAERYVSENIRRVRARLDDPEVPVHAIGGIGDQTTADDVRGMRRATATQLVIGASLYDYLTTSAAVWPLLTPYARR